MVGGPARKFRVGGIPVGGLPISVHNSYLGALEKERDPPW